jgi:hypothetical protein
MQDAALQHACYSAARSETALKPARPLGSGGQLDAMASSANWQKSAAQSVAGEQCASKFRHAK